MHHPNQSTNANLTPIANDSQVARSLIKKHRCDEITLQIREAKCFEMFVMGKIIRNQGIATFTALRSTVGKLA